jgi:hypothetical protein
MKTFFTVSRPSRRYIFESSPSDALPPLFNFEAKIGSL